MSSVFNPADFAAQCEIPSSQAAQLEHLPGWNIVPEIEKDIARIEQDDPRPRGAAMVNKPEGSKATHIDQVSLVEDDEPHHASETSASKDSSALEASMELSPLPDSPTQGLAPVCFDDAVHAPAPEQAPVPTPWASDALPATQAPGIGSDGVGMGNASLSLDNIPGEEDSLADKGQSVPPLSPASTIPVLASPDATIGGAITDGSAQPRGVFGTISRVVMKPFGFGRLATGLFTKKTPEKSAEAAFSATAVPTEQGIACSAAAFQGSPSSIEERLMSRVPPSSNADAVKQGLQLIEQVHQLGSDALQLRSTDLPTTGAGRGVRGAPEVVMGRGDSMVAEAVSQAIQEPIQAPGDAAAAVVAVQLGGGAPAAALPPALEGTPLGAQVAAQSIAVAQAAAASAAGLERAASRKRSAELEDPAEAATGGDAPPKRRRRLRTPMEVVWRFFGVDPTD